MLLEGHEYDMDISIRRPVKKQRWVRQKERRKDWGQTGDGSKQFPNRLDKITLQCSYKKSRHLKKNNYLPTILFLAKSALTLAIPVSLLRF